MLVQTPARIEPRVVKLRSSTPVVERRSCPETVASSGDVEGLHNDVVDIPVAVQVLSLIGLQGEEAHRVAEDTKGWLGSQTSIGQRVTA